MSDAALALVQRLYHRYSEGSIDEFFAVIDPAFTLTSCGPASLFATAGTWCGAEGLRAYLGRLSENWAIEEHTPLEFIQQGGRIAVRTRVRARNHTTGRRVELEKADFWSVEGGRVRAYQEIFDTASLVEAAADRRSDSPATASTS
ncbi:hypothetical protein STAQ_28330 [Allostella sp. ATCC 35155]|nr:hypothetical protein STAQ_28330 [Stella sp. ATCC 35155]